ncbi:MULTISPECIES: MASE3 domain-containing protein [unclassified Clostridium]|uniref:sensor histidine kinase n=1 Tax=unclassified Clostridium TaxID=2614128 RepID=UPI000297C446|nr:MULTISPECIES: MASE3 domain-containing protein [unclassified Clostridium]EKQ51595.1 MAG: PAS domain S-box [Clostridium sp. Maddingley MBC34-26]
MRYIGQARKLLMSIEFEALIEWSFFLIFMGFLLVVNMYNNLFFHTAIELFINVIFVVVFVFAFNTYSINKSNFILILGTGYFFSAILGIFHLLLNEGMPFLSLKESANISAQLLIASKYMGAVTCITSMIFMVRPQKKVNAYALFMIYYFITILLLTSILIVHVFPTCYIESMGLTTFKIISEYLLSAAFFGTAIILFVFGKNIYKYLFICLEIFLILSGESEIFFTSYTFSYDWANFVGHIIKIMAAYFLYKGVVRTGLKRPYNLIYHDLNEADNKLVEFEEIMFNNEQCFNMVINNSDNAIFVVSDNKFVFANNKMAELLGVRGVEDIIGLNFEDVMVNEDSDSTCMSINKIIENKSNSSFIESKLLRLDGNIIEIEVSNCFCTYKRKPSLMVMIRDITPRKQIQLLKNDIVENKKVINKVNELNQMMTEFFSNVSHELKTPLNVILGAIQILALPANIMDNASNESGVYKYLKTMKQNCYRLVRLVNNLIDISKFDSGYFKVDLHNHNVVSVIEDITLSVADYAKDKGIELLFDTDVEEKEMAIDLDKIERIILNLLSNAIKFTPVGGEILVSLYDKETKVLISIKDNGVGIPKDKLDIIFERFGQVEKTLARNKEGSGIGLSLVKSIVDMHEGSIKVISEFGKGCEFLIELPVKLVEEESISDGRLYESRVEKISIEFADIYS